MRAASASASANASAAATTSDGGDGTAVADVADALAYVREVRARFADESFKYHEFLGAMKAFKRGTCVDAMRGDATRCDARSIDATRG